MSLLEKLQKEMDSGPRDVVFLKGKDVTLKLLVPEGRQTEDFYQPFQDSFKGDPVAGALILGIILDSKADPVDPTKAVYIKVRKTVLFGIAGLYDKEWKDILDEKGPCITISTQVVSGKTSYVVTGSRMNFDGAGVERPTTTIDEAAQKQEERALADIAKKSDGGEDLS